MGENVEGGEVEVENSIEKVERLVEEMKTRIALSDDGGAPVCTQAWNVANDVLRSVQNNRAVKPYEMNNLEAAHKRIYTEYPMKGDK